MSDLVRNPNCWFCHAQAHIISDKVDKKDKKKEEPGSFFQRQRVDLLLGELAKKFPPKFVAPTQPGPEVKGICIVLMF